VRDTNLSRRYEGEVYARRGFSRESEKSENKSENHEAREESEVHNSLSKSNSEKVEKWRVYYTKEALQNLTDEVIRRIGIKPGEPGCGNQS
jgi:hypothetical protein